MAQTVEGVKQCFRAAEDSGKNFLCDINSLYNLCLLKGRLFSVLSTEGLTLPLETPTTRFAKVGIVLRIYFGSFFFFFCVLLFSFCFPLFPCRGGWAGAAGAEHQQGLPTATNLLSQAPVAVHVNLSERLILPLIIFIRQ